MQTNEKIARKATRQQRREENPEEDLPTSESSAPSVSSTKDDDYLGKLKVLVGEQDVQKRRGSRLETIGFSSSAVRTYETSILSSTLDPSYCGDLS